MKKWLINFLALTLTLTPAAAEDDALLDYLNNRGYDRDAILRQFQKDAAVTVQPPTPAPDNAADDAAPAQAADETQGGNAAVNAPAADDAAGASAPAGKPRAPRFRELPPPPPDGARVPLTTVALVLPTEAGGLTRAAAMRFHEGCGRALAADGGVLQARLYAHAGAAADAVAAYEQAVADGARMIIGPMQRQNTDALRQAYPRAPAPTVLLQPGGGGGYYVFTLNVEQEMRELARLLAADGYRALLVSDNSALSRRQAAAFSNAWARAAARDIEHFYIFDAQADWQKLFERLKTEKLRAEETPAEDDAPPFAVVAAGDGGFAGQTRNFSPQGIPVFASSIFQGGRQKANAIFLENLHILEMPWFLAEGGDIGGFSAPLTRARPALQQRFFALGVDACRIAGLSLQWFDGWQFAGVSGSLQLDGDVFTRRGVRARYQAGFLRALE